MSETLQLNSAWIRDSSNPLIFPAKGGSFGETVCMNPFVLCHNNMYYIFYAAETSTGRRTVHLATAPADKPEAIEPRGPILANGSEGAFDYTWCVLPHITRMPNGLWHMYYTANSGHGEGLAAFPGIGLAVSDDLLHWKKHSLNPVLTPGGEPGCAGCVGIAGGTVLAGDSHGDPLRFYYTACPTNGDNVFLDQQKEIHLATSLDGVNWRKQGRVMQRDAGRDYENIAVAGPHIIKDQGLYRMWYSAIGTRWGFYSICYAESRDGLNWSRGVYYGQNLQLGPSDRLSMLHGQTPPSWESQMVEYPSVVRENGGLLMYYTGDGYGTGGIGSAHSAHMRAALNGPDGALSIWLNGMDGPLSASLISGISAQFCAATPGALCFGQTHSCDIWLERSVSDADGRPLLRCRVLVLHERDALALQCALINESGAPLENIAVTMSAQTPLRIAFDCGHTVDGGLTTLRPGAIAAGHTINLHGRITAPAPKGELLCD